MRQALGADCLYAARVELICPSQSSYSELTFANANDVQPLLLSGMLVLPQNNNRSKQMEGNHVDHTEMRTDRLDGNVHGRHHAARCSAAFTLDARSIRHHRAQ